MSEIRSLAPWLSGLLYCPAIPDSALQTVLDWSEDVALDDAGRAFALDRLRRVAPALVVAFLASHAYSRSGTGDGGSHGIDLQDIGCGALVETVLSRLETIAVALHRDDGRHLVATMREDLAAKLARISDLIWTR